MAAPASSPLRRLTPALRILCYVVLIGTGSPPLLAAKWSPVDPLELTDSKPQVDPEAGAEILLREVTITHAQVDEFIYTYHVRAKIYSERGLEDFTKVELPYTNEVVVRDVAVRTIKPDGTVLELTKKDIYDREIIKAGKERVKVKAFSPAGLQVGAIVEFTYSEFHDGWSWYVPMYFQTPLPARLVRYKFRPIDASLLAYQSASRLSASALFFNCPRVPMKTDRDGFYTIEMTKLAAAKTEPNQPPAFNCNISCLVCYSLEEKLVPAAYWAKTGKDLHERMLRTTKPTKLVQTTLAGLIAPGDSAEQKLRKIYDFCRTKLLNRYSAAAHFTREERQKFKTNETATDTLKVGHGTGDDLNVVFVALARAAGFDARFAATNDRSFMIFDAGLTEPFNVSDLLAAVKLDGQWRYFDPGAMYLPFAMPYWRNQGTATIIAAPKDAAPGGIPISSAEDSQQKRKAVLRLAPDGSLEGDVTIEYSGQQEVSQKFALDYKTPAERETYIREEIQEYLKLAEVTDVKVENADTPLAPLKVSFHLLIPEYADRTGSRLLFQPAVFQKNAPPHFPEEKRRTNLLFSYRYLDTDEIHVTVPAEFELEEASSPGSFNLGEMGDYQASITFRPRKGELTYSRSFALKAVHLDKKYYSAVRDAFEIIHERDNHTLTLKRKAPGETIPASAPVAPNPPAAATP